MGTNELVRQIAALKMFKASVDASVEAEPDATNAEFCRNYFSSLLKSFDLTALEAMSALMALATVMDDKKFCRVFACSPEMLEDIASDSDVIHAIKSGQDIWDLL